VRETLVVRASRRGSFAVALAALVGAACGGADEPATRQPSADDGVRVASFDFRESVLLAELYAEMIESTGTPVVRIGAVGPREITMPALEQGLVDVVPEYLGTALRWFGAVEQIPDREPALAELGRRLEPLGLVALEAASAQDVNVIVVATSTAERHDLTVISDLAPLAAGMRFGGPPECPDRPLCLIGLEAVYGLRFDEFVSQRSQPFTAEALLRGEIDAGLMFSTDPAVTTRGLTVLDDDRRLQPPEHVVPVVRTDALDRWGADVATALDRLSRALTTSTLRLLNRRVDRGAAVEQVAGDWLRAAGLIDVG
jgi:osmoprotectant transport system substrate-binding protein